MNHPPSPETKDSFNELNLSGQQFGDYLMLRRLGRGGMAEVYLAEQQSLKRQVAFKILRQDLAQDPQHVERFHQEAQAAARLVQANIVQIYHVGKVDGLHFIAQEYVKGQNLKQYLQRFGAVDALLAVNIMRQVAAALSKAAEQGVTHRDIKPENIMLATNGEVKVADFGLARVMEDGRKNQLTQVGITMGTPLYMSPEQVEGRKVDPRSDLYSLGITCYEMLTGRPPFEGDTSLAVAVQHLKNQAKPLHSTRPDLPQSLCDIVHRLMAKEPSDRFNSAADLLRELRDVIVDESDEKWSETLEQLAVIETQALTSQLAVTQQLDQIMKQQSRMFPAHRRRAGKWVVLALCGLGSFAIGSAAAWINRVDDPLRVEMLASQSVPIQSSVESQLRYAQRFPSEEAWLAVGQYFPAVGSESNLNELYGMLADVQLGELYLVQRDYVLALERYQRLANAEEDRFYLVSLAGQAIAYDRIGKVGLANELLFNLEERLRDQTDDTTNGEPSLISATLVRMLNDMRAERGWEPLQTPSS